MATAAVDLGDAAAERRVRRCRDLFEKAKGPKEELHRRWETFYKALNETRSGKKKGLSKPKANEIWPIVTALVGWLGDARPKINYAPSGYDPESQFFEMATKLAQDLERTVDAASRQAKFELEQEKMFFDALTFGTGFLKFGWDPDAADGLGDATMHRTDPWELWTDPLASDSRNWRFVIENRIISRDEAVSRYGEAARNLQAGKEWMGSPRPTQLTKKDSGRTPMAIAGPILGQDTQYGATTKASFEEFKPYEGVSIAECWYLNDRDSWEMSVISGGTELKHYRVAEDLFEFGKPPYVRYCIHEHGEFWGPSLVDFLLSPQEALNDLLFHAHNNIRLAGDPMFEEAVQAGTIRTRLVNQPGKRIAVQAPGMLKWMDPPQMPQALMALLSFWVMEMERISGLAGVTRGGMPQRRENEQALGQMAEGSFTRVRNALRNLEHALVEGGEMLGSIIAENYTEARILSILGPEGEPTVVALRPRHFYVAPEPQEIESEGEPMPITDEEGAPVLDPDTGEPLMEETPEQAPPSEPQPLRFSVWAEAGSANPATHMAQIGEAQAMFGMGIIDREAYLQTRRWPGWKKIVDRIAEKEAQGAFAPPGRRVRQR